MTYRDCLKFLAVLKSNSINKIISQIYSVDKHLIEILLKDGTRIKTNEEVAIEKYGVLGITIFLCSKRKENRLHRYKI